MEKWRKTLLIIAGVCAVCLLCSFLSESGDMFLSLSPLASAGLLVLILLFVFLAVCTSEHFQDKKVKKSEELLSILRVIDTLSVVGAPFHGLNEEIKSFARQQYREISDDGHERLKYLSAKSRYYSASVSEPILFALICVALFAADAEIADLAEYADNVLFEAEVLTRHV